MLLANVLQDHIGLAQNGWEYVQRRTLSGAVVLFTSHGFLLYLCLLLRIFLRKGATLILRGYPAVFEVTCFTVT